MFRVLAGQRGRGGEVFPLHLRFGRLVAAGPGQVMVALSQVRVSVPMAARARVWRGVGGCPGSCQSPGGSSTTHTATDCACPPTGTPRNAHRWIQV